MCVRGGEMLEENGRCYMLVSNTVCFMTEKLFFKNAFENVRSSCVLEA